jgi:hypothetical protein
MPFPGRDRPESSPAFWLQKMTVAAFYRAELSLQLMKLGFAFDAEEGAFRPFEVPRTVLRESSDLRRSIEETLERRRVELAEARTNQPR